MWRRNFLTLLGLKLWQLCFPAHSQSLYWLCYMYFWKHTGSVFKFLPLSFYVLHHLFHACSTQSMSIQEEPISTNHITQLKVINEHTSVLKGSVDSILHIPSKVSELEHNHVSTTCAKHLWTYVIWNVKEEKSCMFSEISGMVILV
jgi:hypothetical protein